MPKAIAEHVVEIGISAATVHRYEAISDSTHAPPDDAVEGPELGVLDDVDDRAVVARAHEVVHRHDLLACTQQSDTSNT